jgi:pimeloyl-ACP methyl ester carboxylesterase
MSDRTAAVFSPPTFAQKTVSFPAEDGGEVYADVSGGDGRGIVLAHGGRFNHESRKKQARTLAARGFRVSALDFRGYGKSQGPGQFSPMSAPLSLRFTGRCPILPQRGCDERVGSRGAAWEEEPPPMRPAIAHYCNLAYSVFACCRIGISESASLHSPRKSR